MKKIFSFALLAAATLSVLSSCMKEYALSEEGVAGNGPASFIAYLDEDDTKTSIDGLKVKWNDGDEISVNGSIYVATVDGVNPSVAEFKLKEGQTAPTGSTFRAYYPTSTFVSTTYTQRYKLQGTQTYNGDDVSSISYMYAQTESMTNELHFKNVCGLLKIQLKGTENVKLIQVSALTGNYLYGTISNFTYNATTEAISYSSFTTSGRGTTVTLDCGKGVQLKKDEATDFYIAIPEKEYSSLKIVVSTDGGDKTINSTTSCPVVKNKIYTIAAEVSFPVLEFDAEISVTDVAATSATAATATLNITPKDNDVYYMYAIESPGYVGQYPDPLDLAKADIEFWKGQGATSLDVLIAAGLAVKGPFSEAQTGLSPNSEYIPYAYAIDKDFNVSPAVIGSKVTTPEYVWPEISAQYEDYLGQWIMGNDLLTVTEKVSGSTYNVAGIKNQNYPTYNYNIEAVEASFEKGYIVLKEQKTDATTSVGSHGTCDLYLSGVFSYQGDPYGYYPINAGTGGVPQEIFRGALKDNKITVSAGSCQYGDFESMGFSWVIQSGTNKGKGNTFAGTTLGDMIKYVEPTGPTPEGQWFCASVTDYWGEGTYTNWTMTIEKSGPGFKINNFDQGFDEFLESQVPGLHSQAPVAIWDATAKTLTIAAQTQTGISAGENLYWTGLNGNDEVDIVLAFDFDNNTCAYTTALWGAYLPDATEPGFYSLYRGPEMVFSKVNSETSSTKAMNNFKFGGKIPYVKSMVKHTAFDHYKSIKSEAQIATMSKVNAEMKDNVKVARVAL